MSTVHLRWNKFKTKPFYSNYQPDVLVGFDLDFPTCFYAFSFKWEFMCLSATNQFFLLFFELPNIFSKSFDWECDLNLKCITFYGLWPSPLSILIAYDGIEHANDFKWQLKVLLASLLTVLLLDKWKQTHALTSYLKFQSLINLKRK